MPYRRFWYRLAAFMSGYGIEQLRPGRFRQLLQAFSIGNALLLYHADFDALKALDAAHGIRHPMP
jgi:hypothetical protein